jgi:hypothetical protein
MKRRIEIEHLASGAVVKSPLMIQVEQSVWSPDSQVLAVAGNGIPSDNGNPAYAAWVQLIDSATGEIKRRFRIGTDRTAATAVTWSPDGKFIAAGTMLGECDVWNAAEGTRRMSERIHRGRVNALAWSPDGRRVASCSVKGQISVWDPVTGEQCLGFTEGSGRIERVRWSPDGMKLAAVDEEGLVTVWDASQGFRLQQEPSWTHLQRPEQWKRFNRLVSEERWAEAGQVLRVMELQTPDDFHVLDRLAILSRLQGNLDTHRATCERMLELATKSDTAFRGWMAVATVTSFPESLSDYTAALRICDEVVRRKRDFHDPNQFIPHYEGLKGLVLFRAGRFDEALPILLRAHESSSASGGTASLEFFLAMTCKSLGRHDEAREWLTQGQRSAQNELGASTAGALAFLVQLEREAADSIRQ